MYIYVMPVLLNITLIKNVFYTFELNLNTYERVLLSFGRYNNSILKKIYIFNDEIPSLHGEVNNI